MKIISAKNSLVCLIVIANCILNNTQGQEKPGVFYSVTGTGIKDTSWLFGTYHLINDSYLDETPGVLNAFTRSKQLLVEVIVDSMELPSANSKALLKDKTLTQMLDKSFVDSLDFELKTMGASVQQFQAFKPMMVMLTLSMVNLIRDNQALLQKYKGTPLDAGLVGSAKSAGKEILALETITQQMDFLFNAISDEQQVHFLKEFIRNKAQNVQVANDLLRAYLENDLGKIYSIYLESIKTGGDMDFLIANRNENWMKVIPSLLQEKSVFVAVGALHLAGPNGLVEQLKKQGYIVTPRKLR